MLTYTLLHDVDCMVRCCAVVCLWCVWCVACATGRIARRGSYPCYWAEPFRPHGQPSTSLGKSSLLSAPFFPTLPLPLLPPSPYILLPLHPSVSLLSLLFFKKKYLFDLSSDSLPAVLFLSPSTRHCVALRSFCQAIDDTMTVTFTVMRPCAPRGMRIRTTTLKR